jgi:vitamin B12 transporter
LLLALTPPTAEADDPAPDPVELAPLIVISATRVPTPEDEVGSTVTVVTGDEIARKQQRTLTDALEAIPGLSVVQSGGQGSVSSVFIRGTNSNHTKVLVDGIDMGDPSTPTGAFDFAHLATAGIDRIEVLRGPQSGVYGADAVGGVIDIVTKSGKGPATISGASELGSFGTFNQDASIGGSNSRFNYIFNASHLRSNDTPVTPAALLLPGHERIGDSYDNKTYSTKLGARLSDTFDAGLVARYIDTSLRFIGDDFSVFPSVPASEKTQSDTRQLFTRGTGRWLAFDGALDQMFGIAYSDYLRRDLSPGSGPVFNRGDRVKADWQGNVALDEENLLVVGLERQLDELRDSPASAETVNTAGFVQLQSSYDGRYFNTLSVRQDENSRVGGNTTYRLAPSILFSKSATRIKGSIGTAFKAPSLQQLFVDFPAFDFFANPDLKPEKSLGYDAGFEQSVLAKSIRFGSTYFHNSIDDLIAANAAGNSYANIARAETYGFESFISYKPSGMVTLRGDHTYTLANDEVLNQQLLRRPKHKASLSATWQASRDVSLSATAIYVGPRIDGNRDFSVQRLKANGYGLLNLAGTYDLGGGVAAFARIDNVLDKRYEDPTGFERPGLGVFIGLRVALGLSGELEEARP